MLALTDRGDRGSRGLLEWSLVGQGKGYVGVGDGVGAAAELGMAVHEGGGVEEGCSGSGLKCLCACHGATTGEADKARRG